MSSKGHLVVLCVLTIVSCRGRGRGDQTSLERLTIVEPLNQNQSPYTVKTLEEIRLKCVATGFPQMIQAHWEKMSGGKVVLITNMWNPTPEDSDKYEVSSGSSMENDFIDEFYLTIKEINYEDEGGYNCYTFYNGKKIYGSLLLKVDGPPIVRLFENSINVQEGLKVNLSCHYLAKPPPYNTSYWARNGQEIDTYNSMKYRKFIRTIPGVMLGYGEITLEISSTTVADSGNYSCVVINYFGSAYGTVQMDVSQRVLPDFPSVGLSIRKTHPLSHTWTADVNTEMKIVCKAEGFTHPPNMSWIFFGVDGSSLKLSSDEERMGDAYTINTYSTQNSSGCFYTLYIGRLHFSNSGTFVCKVENVDSTMDVDYLNLTVTGIPLVEATDFILNATLGESVTMRCHIWSYPQPDTVWKLENILLSSNARYKTTKVNLNPIEQESVLTISSITEKDFGVYACNVYNSRGSAMAIHILQDVDECSFDPPCNQQCENLLGTFECSCDDGYYLPSHSTTQCEGRYFVTPCNQKCENLLGTFECSCDDGYYLPSHSTTQCEDINECTKPDSQACSQICTNLNGSFACSCHDGFTLDIDNYDCNDNSGKEPNSGEDHNEGDSDSTEEIITPETLYTVIGVCAGGLLAIVLLILIAVYCRRRKYREEEFGEKNVFNTNVAYEPSIEKEAGKLNSYMSTFKYAQLKDEFPRQRLQLGIDLGQGRFGKVMMARALNINGSGNWEMVAVKTSRDSASDCEKEDLISELDIMRKIPKHKSIVAYLGCCTKQDPVYILMEYVKGGNLQAYLRKCRPSQQATTSEEVSPPSAKDLKTIALQIARGMCHLHTCGIIHRDLSARNILVTPELICKICDFGLSRDVEGCDVYERSSKGPLPIRWMAPESLTDQWFTKKTDVWSYGVLLWEIVTLGATPYPGMAAREVIIDVTMGKWLQKPLHCKQELYSMMTSCWAMDAATRPTFKEIVCDAEALLSQEAEYIELNTYQEENYNVLENVSDERV